MNKGLILITSMYPYGNAETFLETEILYLNNFFETITIIPIHQQNTKRNIPSKCKLLPFQTSNKWHWKQLIKSLLIIEITRELLQISISKSNVGIFKTMLVSLNNAIQIENHILSNFNKQELKNIVLYSYWCDDSALALALLKKKYPSLKIISRTNGWDLYFETNKYNYLPFKPFITNNLNEIFTISTKGKIYIKKYWNTHCSPKISHLGVIPNSILDINKNEIILISCSNLIKLKRVDLILEALKTIKSINIKWVHFGDGPELEALTQKSVSVDSNIKIEWKGRVKNHEIISYYKENKPSLFINVSSSEGIPVSIMEAFSFGIPVIATNVGGTNEIVEDGKNGLLLHSNPTVIEVANAIIKILTLDNVRLNNFKINAFETVHSKFNAEKNYTSFCQQIQSLE
jgi:glycosyltransferase involved in cell wall biosynthesis